eukprot:1676320-Rhodomonas_salina.2
MLVEASRKVPRPTRTESSGMSPDSYLSAFGERDLHVVDVAGGVGPHRALPRLVVAVGIAGHARARRDARKVLVLPQDRDQAHVHVLEEPASTQHTGHLPRSLFSLAIALALELWAAIRWRNRWESARG